MFTMRVAFFGGTFDPIHRGHLRIAAAAAQAFSLDRVLFAPVGHQPLKAEPAIASYADRLAMIALAVGSEELAGSEEPAEKLPALKGRDFSPAIKSLAEQGFSRRGNLAARAPTLSEPSAGPQPDNPEPPTCNFLPSTLDAPRPDGAPNYTVDTLAALSLEFPAAELFVLIGADSFLDLRRWRSPDRLLHLAEWIVVSRPDFPIAEAQLQSLAPTPAQRQRIHLLNSVHEEVSATELRRRLRTGDPCPGLLPPTVSTYIQSHHLYS
jgi:cytidyltransferase-like protein